MLKDSENNGTEENNLVTPPPGIRARHISISSAKQHTVSYSFMVSGNLLKNTDGWIHGTCYSIVNEEIYRLLAMRVLSRLCLGIIVVRLFKTWTQVVTCCWDITRLKCMPIDNTDNDSYYGIISLSFTSLLVRLSIWLPQSMSNKINVWAAFISILLIFCYVMFLSAIYTLIFRYI